MCCIAAGVRIRQCDMNLDNQYKHTSKTLRTSSRYWNSGLDGACGIYATDMFTLQDSQNREYVFKNFRFVMSVHSTLDNFNGEIMKASRLGLRRRKDGNTLVEIMKRDGYINNAIINIAALNRHIATLSLGTEKSERCGSWNRHKIVDNNEWMVDAEDLQFFTQKEIRKFRVSND